MSLSVFPNGGIDTWTYLQDLSASDLLNAETYRNLRIKSSTIALSSEEQTQVNSIAANLRYKGINVVDLNKLFDAISSTQLFTQTTLINYFKYCGSYNPLTNYLIYNSVSYNGNTFMSLKNQIGVTPVDDGINWKQNSSKGDIGNPGATGANGLGLTYVGNYSDTSIYYIGNAFNSNNSIYYCTNTSPAGTSPTNTSYFQLFLSNSGVVIQATEPVSKYVNLVWIDSSTSQNIMKYWTGSAWSIVGGNIKALDISIADAGNKITATNVEDFATEMVDKITILNGSGAVAEKANKSALDTTNTNVTNLTNTVNTHTSSLADYTKIIPYAGTSTGTVNAYVIATPTIAALTVGMAVSLKFNIDSTLASTLNWNGKGAKGIKKANGMDVTNLKTTGIYTLRYDGTNFILQGEGGSGDATAPDLLSGKKASTDTGDITGTMVDRGTVNITPSSVSQTILGGKHSGAGVVSAVTIPVANVLIGTTIAGQSGTMANNASPTTALTTQGATKVIPAGYNPGGTITANFANLLAENVLSGVNIGGIVGNLVLGKAYASGTVTTDGNARFTVSGLNFLPKLILASQVTKIGDSSTTKFTIYVDFPEIATSGTKKRWATSWYALGASVEYVNSSGFCLDSPAGTVGSSIFWIALG